MVVSQAHFPLCTYGQTALVAGGGLWLKTGLRFGLLDAKVH